MNKLCCCIEQDVPDISLNFTCACCESRVQQRKTNDSTDLETSDKKVKIEVEEKKEHEDEDGDEEKRTVCCCCFARKRHAKDKMKKKRPRDGSRT